MAACNAEATLERTWRDLPRDGVDEVILVDDASQDRTVEIARRLNLTVVEHERNRGYGGDPKTCYRAALPRGADGIAVIHPHYQYDAPLPPPPGGFLAFRLCDALPGSPGPRPRG